ncbi:hypothetical protein PCANC_16579 [Puccinia coronata f. sp. avenae]|uniref:Major facilitator superfamily (MFS) profile domain-containing protein n=1 Tax=Puccinia coronata f. sp. avenae TaxID=200324 RepID=A0A2N5UM30_9BASI|nr:hypothetical protein PCASD_21066 [Puccinia coronata f. sp. avenae]PLW16028.1 hypothetical protein PCANC_18033 [Puccinia coronata f. sp. avenae]PLW38828.1 hypothetical protein PCANC_16579 [Puccinia coronata f. sp. avenae]PLW48480.1 hypothetical protein PCASD_04288 [Puccinia coronata f. sp. avenae]
MQASQFSIFLAAAFVALFSLQISAAVLPRQLIPAAPARGKAASTSLQAVTDGLGMGGLFLPAMITNAVGKGLAAGGL